MMDGQSLDDVHKQIHHIENDDVSMDEELKFSLCAGRKNVMTATLETEICNNLDEESCVEEPKCRILGFDEKHSKELGLPKELEVNHGHNHTSEHEHNKDELVKNSGILGGHGVDEHNCIYNGESMSSETSGNSINFHDGDPHICSSPMRELAGFDSNAQTEMCSIADRIFSKTLSDDQDFQSTSISLSEIGHLDEKKGLIDHTNSVSKKAHCSDIPASENGESLEVDNHVKASKSLSNCRVDDQLLESLVMSAIDDVSDTCKVNELENIVGIQMNDRQFSVEPILENTGITQSDQYTQKALVSLEGRTLHPQMVLSNDLFMQESSPSARLDDRGSTHVQDSPRHDESYHACMPLQSMDSSPVGLVQQDSRKSIISLKNGHLVETISAPTKANNLDNSPESIGQRPHSPSGKSNDGKNHLPQSYHNADSNKHSLRSPGRDVPHKRESSKSHSPTRRRDSSHQQRGKRDRSRSRSPYARERHRRSPRRQHSPKPRLAAGSSSRRQYPRMGASSSAHRAARVGKPGRNIFIAGFSFSTTERDLERKFSRFGHITDVRIVRNPRSGDSRGFGFLSLERDEEADAAIRALDQTEWNGRIILVEKSKSASR